MMMQRNAALDLLKVVPAGSYYSSLGNITIIISFLTLNTNGEGQNPNKQS